MLILKLIEWLEQREKTKAEITKEDVYFTVSLCLIVLAILVIDKVI